MHRSTTCSAEHGRRLARLLDTRPWILPAWSGAGALLLLAGLVSPSTASKEVLSDMDCVVEPSLVVDLGTASPGQLAETFHDRSDFVQRGELMGRLESRVEAASLAIAEADAADVSALELRRLSAAFGSRTRTRNDRLGADEAISAQTLDQVRTETAMAEMQVLQEQRAQAMADLEVVRARAVLARRELRSPIEGTVVARLASAGEYIDSDPVYRIARLDPLHVEVIVPIDYLGALQVGSMAGVTLQAPGFEQRVLEASVRRIDGVADPASATYGVRLLLDNPDMDIPSGVRCSVDFFAS